MHCFGIETQNNTRLCITYVYLYIGIYLVSVLGLLGKLESTQLNERISKQTCSCVRTFLRIKPQQISARVKKKRAKRSNMKSLRRPYSLATVLVMFGLSTCVLFGDHAVKALNDVDSTLTLNPLKKKKKPMPTRVEVWNKALGFTNKNEAWHRSDCIENVYKVEKKPTSYSLKRKNTRDFQFLLTGINVEVVYKKDTTEKGRFDLDNVESISSLGTGSELQHLFINVRVPGKRVPGTLTSKKGSTKKSSKAGEDSKFKSYDLFPVQDRPGQNAHKVEFLALYKNLLSCLARLAWQPVLVMKQPETDDSKCPWTHKQIGEMREIYNDQGKLLAFYKGSQPTTDPSQGFAAILDCSKLPCQPNSVTPTHVQGLSLRHGMFAVRGSSGTRADTAKTINPNKASPKLTPERVLFQKDDLKPLATTKLDTAKKVVDAMHDHAGGQNGHSQHFLSLTGNPGVAMHFAVGAHKTQGVVGSMSRWVYLVYLPDALTMEEPSTDNYMVNVESEIFAPRGYPKEHILAAREVYVGPGNHGTHHFRGPTYLNKNFFVKPESDDFKVQFLKHDEVDTMIRDGDNTPLSIQKEALWDSRSVLHGRDALNALLGYYLCSTPVKGSVFGSG